MQDWRQSSAQTWRILRIGILLSGVVMQGGPVGNDVTIAAGLERFAGPRGRATAG